MKRGNKVIELREFFNTIEDPRDIRGKVYPLHYVLSLIIIGFLWGKNDFVNIEHCLKNKKKDLKKIMDITYGIPSHDTMSRLMRIIKEKEMIYAIMDWMAALVKSNHGHIAIDGKGIRAGAEKSRQQRTPYILNAIDVHYKFVIGQISINEKTNEISGIMAILNLLEIRNQTITIDAIGTQTEIINKILDEGGHYVLPVKKNQGTTMDNIAIYMCDLIEDKLKVKKQPNYVSEYEEELYEYQESESTHGRMERREYYLSYRVSCINKKRFGSVKAVGYVIRTREIPVKNETGEILSYEKSKDEIAYIMDQKLDVKVFAEYVRNHWKIENSLHWVLDNTFKEDRATIRKGNALANTSLLRKVSYDIIRICKTQEDKSFEYIRDEFRDNIEKIKEYVIDGIESFY